MTRRSRTGRGEAPEPERPPVVELAGAPGSGKTTLMPFVLESVRSEGFDPLETTTAARTLAARTLVGRMVVRFLASTSREQALWLVYLCWATVSALGYLMVHPALAGILWSQRGRPRESLVAERQVVRWFVRYLGTERLFRRLGGAREVLVVDEGYAHRVVQLFTSVVEQGDPVQIDRYLGLVPAPSLLITIDVPSDVAARRLAARGVWDRMSEMDPSEVSTFVTNAHRAVEFVETLARRRGWRVEAIDNTEEPMSRPELPVLGESHG